MNEEMSKIIAKIIIGVEKKADMEFVNPTDPLLFQYVIDNFIFMRNVIPSKFTNEDVVEETINRIATQYILGMPPFNH